MSGLSIESICQLFADKVRELETEGTELHFEEAGILYDKEGEMRPFLRLNSPKIGLRFTLMSDTDVLLDNCIYPGDLTNALRTLM